MRIAVLGGTGALGSGLVKRWSNAGHSVTIGSRDPARGKPAAEALGVDIAGYAEAVAGAQVAALTVPSASQIKILTTVRDALEGKILIDTTVPLVPPKVSRVQLPPEGSAAQRAEVCFGSGVRVVSAFQNVGAKHLHTGELIDSDVLPRDDARDDGSPDRVRRTTANPAHHPV